MSTKSKNTFIVIIALIIIAVLVFKFGSFGDGASSQFSTVGTTGCTTTKYVGVDSKSYSSFDDMRNTISDMKSFTNADFAGYGLSERSDGVYVCK